MNFRQHAANAAAAKFLDRRNRRADQRAAKTNEGGTLLRLKGIECAGRERGQWIPPVIA